MNKIMIATIALLSSACTVHAHPHPTPPACGSPPATMATAYVPHPNAPPTNVKVQAWVWVKGHQTSRAEDGCMDIGSCALCRGI